MIGSKSRIRLASATAASFLLLVVGVFAQSNNGCYVKVYDSEDFKGRSATLRGPGRDADLDDNKWSGSNSFIGDDTDSMVTGPNAYFEGFEDKNFKGTAIRVGPNKRITDIETLGIADEFESYRLYNKAIGCIIRNPFTGSKAMVVDSLKQESQYSAAAFA